jgi:hypothetical protein
MRDFASQLDGVNAHLSERVESDPRLVGSPRRAHEHDEESLTLAAATKTDTAFVRWQVERDGALLVAEGRRRCFAELSR